MNTVLLAGDIDDLYSTGTQYFVRVKVDEEIIEIELWSKIYYVLLEKPFDTPIAVKGYLRVSNEGLLTIMAEQVSIITQKP